MDALADHLLSKVFLRLQLRDRVRARLVCKHWNRLLSLCEQEVQISETWVCMERSDGKLTEWCPASGTTFGIAAQCISSHGPSVFSILASSHGLLLAVCRVDAPQEFELAVGNPLTNTWDILPRFYEQVDTAFYECDLSMLSPSSASMVADTDCGHYKIVLSILTYPNMGEIESEVPFFYNSVTNLWHEEDGGPRPRKTLYVDDVPEDCLVIHMWWRLNVYDPQSGQFLQSVNLEGKREIFRKFRGFMDGSTYEPFEGCRLGSYKGRIMFIEALPDCSGYAVSELAYCNSGESWAWKDVSTFCDGTHACGDWRPWFMFEGDYVVAFSAKGAIAFDLDKLSWHHLLFPPNITITEKGYRRCFAFKPNLLIPTAAPIEERDW